MKTEDILNECRDIVDEICLKYNYNTKDVEGIDSLRTVLLKAIPLMLKDSNKDERNLFYQMLSHTPIVITKNLTQEGYNELVEQFIGKDSRIIEENKDLGEYGKLMGAGAYVSNEILDENMNLKGKKSFVYIQKVDKKAEEFLGTDINVAHLIHELGHAWHAEKDQYTMQKDGTLKERIGTAEFTYSFSKAEDNRIVKKCIKTTGLMIEESMNTVAEENAMADYMGISLEEMQNEYTNILVPSNYQGYMASFVRYMYEELGKADFEKYRLYGDIESKDRINSLMEKTQYWINRESDILPISDSPRSYDKKQAIINGINNEQVQEFFKQYASTYFPDVSKMTPLEKIDNVLEQKYNMNMIRYSMDIEDYRNFLDRLGYEGYSLINQTSDLLKEKKREEITPYQAVKNALKNTTTDKVYEASTMEKEEKDINKELGNDK